MSRDKNEYLAMRQRYQPAHIKLIIVAESPPSGGKYFYDADGSRGEPLFAAMMRQLKATPASKVEGLLKVPGGGLDPRRRDLRAGEQGAQQEEAQRHHPARLSAAGGGPGTTDARPLGADNRDQVAAVRSAGVAA